jgi:hypothetical protein
MKWTIDRNDWKIVRDDSFRVVCYADTYQIAAKIVEDHNKIDDSKVEESPSRWTQEQIDAMHDEKSNVKR